MRWLSAAVIAAAVAGVLVACPDATREICNNGVDDDHNGFIDCADIDCAGQEACPSDGGYFGSCAKCGQTCGQQSQCVQSGFAYGYDVPLPTCVDGKCQSFNSAVEVNLEFDTSAWTAATAPSSMAVRFISKRAQDGSAVSCATVQAAAQGKTAADVDQLEKNGKFVYVAFDARPRQLSNPFAPNFTFPLLKVATGGNYLAWIEVWGGPVNPDTKLPSGLRLGWMCDDSSSQLGPVVPADNCGSTTSDAGNCRTYHFVMPGPQ